MGTLTGFSSRSVDFFVADPRGYGSIFLKMADNFKDKIFLNKVVKSVSTAVMAFIELLPWMERCSLGNMDSALSVQAFFQVIQLSSLLNFLSGKLKPLTRFHWRTTQKFSSIPLQVLGQPRIHLVRAPGQGILPNMDGHRST